MLGKEIKTVSCATVLLIFLLGIFVGTVRVQAVVVSSAAQLVEAVENANNGGDKTIFLNNGTYTLDDMLPIWADGVTVQSVSGNRDLVIVRGQGMTGSVTHIFNVAASNFTAKNMTLGWVANHAIQIWGNNNSSNNLLSNLHIVDTYEQMVKVSSDGSSANSSKDCIMENCLLEYSAGVGPQYYIGGIDAHQAKNWIVRNNTFKNISSPGGDVAEHAIHFWSDSQGTLVENNRIIDCDRGIGFGLGDRGHNGGIIRNNMITHSASDSGYADVSIGLENASNAQVYNNTIYTAHTYPYAIEYRFAGTAGGMIKNNLCNRPIVARDGGTSSLGGNIINAVAPWFTGVASGDLHLASAVPQVVDKGVVIQGLTRDYDGDLRPQGAGIDIGADEYTTGGSGGYEPPFGVMDTPVEGATVSGSIAVTGWALDDLAVTSLKIYRAAVVGEGSALIYIGDAIFVSGARPDVQNLYPNYPGSHAAGWGYMLLTHFLPGNGNGTFTLYAIATDGSGNQTTLGSKGIVCDNAHAVKPFGAIDAPGQGGTASGRYFLNWGWVLTPSPGIIPTDGSTIHVWVDGVNIGHPTYNLYRSDIASLFPGYANSNGAVGYFSLDTTPYSNGVHTIQWTATDNAGHTDGIGSRYFTINNGSRGMPSFKEESADTDLREFAEPLRVKTGFLTTTPADLILPDRDGCVSITINALQRLEIGFPPFTRNLSPLPVGSTMDIGKGIFYWFPGPGFLGCYDLSFVDRQQNRLIKVRVTIMSR